MKAANGQFADYSVGGYWNSGKPFGDDFFPDYDSAREFFDYMIQNRGRSIASMTIYGWTTKNGQSASGHELTGYDGHDGQVTDCER